MSLQELQIYGVRNIRQAQFNLNHSFNIFYGNNGSGKTSLLEAVYLLTAGYSFKTRETLPLVSYGEPYLTVFGKTFNDETVSLRKTIAGPTQVKQNRETCSNSSVLARFLPCQIFYQDIFNIIDAGPAVRRSLLDWGVFHVKHEYHSLWRDYRQVLKQRNALLRQSPTRKNMLPWDQHLVRLANGLDQLRLAYFQEWAKTFQYFLLKLSDIECTIEYYRGWRARENDLAAILEEQFNADCQRQYTQSGAHQADIHINSLNTSAKKELSRGQQKMVLIALKLSQGFLLDNNRHSTHLNEKPNNQCIYLFDDITAELDSEHLYRLIQCLSTINGQKIMTVLDKLSIQPLLEQIDVGYFGLPISGEFAAASVCP